MPSIKAGAECTDTEIKIMRMHLADFKIPKHICFLNEIPKGATGKMQRIAFPKAWQNRTTK